MLRRSTRFNPALEPDDLFATTAKGDSLLDLNTLFSLHVFDARHSAAWRAGAVVPAVQVRVHRMGRAIGFTDLLLGLGRDWPAQNQAGEYQQET